MPSLPMELKNDVIFCGLKNTLKFSLAPSALAICTLVFGLKRRKNAQIVVCVFRAPESGRFFKGVSGFAPLWKFFCGCPCIRVNMQKLGERRRREPKFFSPPLFRLLLRLCVRTLVLTSLYKFRPVVAPVDAIRPAADVTTQ